MPHDGVQTQGAGGDIPGDGTDLVQRRGVSHQTIAANHAIGGLQTHHSTEGRRLANASAGVRTQGVDCLASGNRCRSSSATAAGNPFQIPGIPSREEGRVFAGRTHGVLVHVALAQQNGALEQQSLGHRGVVDRHIILEHSRRTGRCDTLGGDDVFHLHGYPRQRPGFTCSDTLIGLFGLLERQLGRHGDERLNTLLQFVDAFQVRAGKLNGGNLPLSQLFRGFMYRCHFFCGHRVYSSRTALTRKYSPSGLGALRSTSSGSKESSSSSSRMTACRSTA